MYTVVRGLRLLHFSVRDVGRERSSAEPPRSRPGRNKRQPAQSPRYNESPRQSRGDLRVLEGAFLE